jgi:hypothetical protein
VGKITHIKVLGLALFAVFAFSAFAAASAFAVSEWLFNGAPIGVGAELATDTEGTLVLDVLNEAGTVLVNEIDCSSLFEGTVGAGSLDLVLDVFSLLPGNELIEELEPLVGTEGKSLSCETLFDNGGELGEACKLSTEAGSETLLWVENLSLAGGLTWESLVELDAATFLDHFVSVAFELRCVLLAGVTLNSLCEGLTSGLLENVAPNVLLEFGEGPASEPLNCTNTVGGMGVPLTFVDLTGDLIIKHATGGTLAVS